MVFLALGFGAAYLGAAIDGGLAPAEAASSIYKLNTDSRAGHFVVPIGKSETFHVGDDFEQVVIGDSTVADVVPLSSRSVYILGKKLGSTNLSLYDSNKRLLGVIDIDVSYDLDDLRAQLRRNISGSAITVSSVNGKVLLSGMVPSAAALDKATLIARQYAPDAVTTVLSVGTPQQVMLEVRFIEASHNAGRELGLRWDVLSNSFSATTGSASLLSNATPFGTFVTRLLSGGLRADVIIRSLEQKGLARRLAEPNLTALSGDTASFLAGGEFPFPVQADNDRITIEFKKFGVGLAFTPTVLSDGLINLKIEPEVSQLDPTNTLRVNNIEIPSLIVRRAKTTVELRDGQSFAIAGLLQTNHTKNNEQLPWIGSVPVLGALFRSASYQKQQTDLVIIVTPRLVQPVPPGKRLATPLDKTAPTNDAEYFLTGKQEVNRNLLHFMETGGKLNGPFGHMLKLKSGRRP